jgi:hypothetical protein
METNELHLDFVVVFPKEKKIYEHTHEPINMNHTRLGRVFLGRAISLGQK